MAKSDSDRTRESQVSGIPCPQCGHTKSTKVINDRGEAVLTCRRCGHRWEPERA